MRIKSLVLDSVTSEHSKRAYEQALDGFARWCVDTGGVDGQPGFTRATVQAHRAALEAADNGLLAPETASAIVRVRGTKRRGTRVGNWLTLDQAERLLDLPYPQTRVQQRDGSWYRRGGAFPNFPQARLDASYFRPVSKPGRSSFE